ncbi:MAG: hypothetical protein AUH29_16740 [Candidatus Rokubacteria bacterium 13_1_40CM_69_27]|nr:MAG: hypothetical protein AUH29_16740 [Candidatus Rokubacteria bacterium 13_1_40CM_69_27]OLC39163.1 MAG: hypothetical protein AUH81_02605 [Candidatus Rokubacteria bacterium 13_1_40CM_4_69_5]
MAAAVLHLLKGDHPAVALATIARQVQAGDEVAVALLHGAPAPSLPARVRVHRVPDDVSYEQLLEKIFAADQVITW